MPTENPTPQEVLRDKIDYNTYTTNAENILAKYTDSKFIDSIDPIDPIELLEYLISEYDTSNKDTLTFFRSFSERLIKFLPENEQEKIMKNNPINQNGVLSKENKNRIKKYLTEQLKKYNTTERTISNWFNSKKITIPQRKKAFAICFALNLSIDATNMFLSKVCFSSGFNIHQYDEAIYYFCIKNNYTFKDAEDLIKKAKENLSEKKNTTLPFTKTIEYFLDDEHTSKEALLKYINEYYSQEPVENRTAQNIIKRQKKTLIDSKDSNGHIIKGYITREPEKFQDNFLSADLRNCDRTSDDYILTGIYGMDIRNKQNASKKDSPFPKHFTSKLPDKDITESDEDARSLIILLGFYKYWMDLALTKEILPANNMPSAVISQINADLNGCHYPELYPGNLYDALFLAASYYETDVPMEHIATFRDFIRRIFPPIFYFDEAEEFFDQSKDEATLAEVFSNGIITPSHLASTLNTKYARQSSLSQIIKSFESEGIKIDQKEMANGIIISSKTCFAVLLERIKQELLTFPVIQTAKAIVYADNANSKNNYYIQAYCSDESSTKYPIVIYECHQEQNLKSSVFYTDYEGILVDDNDRTPSTQKALESFYDGDMLWKIYNSENGTYSSTVIYSLLKTAQFNKLKPKDYFEYLLTELPKLCDTDGIIDSTKLDDLLPWSSNLPENCRSQTNWW